MWLALHSESGNRLEATRRWLTTEDGVRELTRIGLEPAVLCKRYSIT